MATSRCRRWCASEQFLFSQFIRPRGRPPHEVGNTDAPLDQVPMIGRPHSFGHLHPVFGETGGMQSWIEAVARVGENELRQRPSTNPG